MLDLVEEMGMTVVVVTDDEISQAQRELALDGYCVEPTSAVAWAAYRRTHPRGRTVVALTGNGLKSLAEWPQMHAQEWDQELEGTAHAAL